MTAFTINTILGFSIIIPSLLGIARFKEVVKTYQPILILFLIALINEFFSPLLASKIYNTSFNNNIYVLIEALFFLWQFYRWGFFQKTKSIHIAIIVITVTLWLFDNFIINKISTTNPLFRVYYSTLLIFLSIDQINRLIVNERGSLFSNSRFLFCIGILFFYSYKALIESFYLFKFNLSNDFYHEVFLILAFVNLFVNFLYGLAVLWIPTREKFTMRF